jgi:hypothetical protein
MPNQNVPQITARKDTTNRISDFDGNVILEIGQQEYTVRQSDKSITHHRINENIRLVCGTIWNALMMAKILVGICQQCRVPSFFHSRTHGIVAMNRAKLCADCGTLCCPRHKKLGRDQKWRCLKHHKTHLVKNLGRSIFFDRKEE